MRKRHCSTLGGIPCWSTLLFMLKCLPLRRRTPVFVDHLPDSITSLAEMTTLSELRVKHFVSLARVMSVDPGASLFLSARFNEGWTSILDR